MRKVYILITSFILSISFSFAQMSMERQVFSSFGHSEENGISLVGTLGETLIAFAQQGNSSVSSGFQQQDITSTDNDELNDIQFSVFPIPAESFLQINSKEPINTVELFNVLGQNSMSKTGLNKHNVTLDIRQLTQGNYLLKCHIDNQIKVKKIIIL